jgi:hypothetical protein
MKTENKAISDLLDSVQFEQRLRNNKDLNVLLSDKGFNKNLYHEILNLDAPTKRFVEDHVEFEPTPYVFYDIYQTPKSIIKGGKQPKNRDYKELVIHYAKLEEIFSFYKQLRYADLKAIKKDLFTDLSKINEQLYLDAITNTWAILPGMEKRRDEQKVVLKNLLQWYFGWVDGLGFHLYNIDEDFYPISVKTGGLKIGKNYKEINSLRNEGANVYLKIELADYILEEWKNARQQIDVDQFIEEKGGQGWIKKMPNEHDVYNKLLYPKLKYQEYENIYHQDNDTTMENAHYQLRQRFIDYGIDITTVDKFINPDYNSFYQSYRNYKRKNDLN